MQSTKLTLNLNPLLFLNTFSLRLTILILTGSFNPTRENSFSKFLGSKGGAVVRALAFHQCGPGSNPGVDMWVEFVVGSLPCSERFFSGYSGFPLSPKTNTSKFQFDLERTDTDIASWVNKLHLHFF